jgi:hypothetical protein
MFFFDVFVDTNGSLKRPVTLVTLQSFASLVGEFPSCFLPSQLSDNPISYQVGNGNGNSPAYKCKFLWEYHRETGHFPLPCLITRGFVSYIYIIHIYISYIHIQIYIYHTYIYIYHIYMLYMPYII